MRVSHLSLLGVCLTFTACSGGTSDDEDDSEVDTQDSDSDSDSDSDTDDDTDSDSGTDTAPEDVETQSISGSVTWNVDFDEAAEATGLTDCSYTRDYQGVQDVSAPWLCADCDIVFRSDVVMSAGRDDCYTQVTEAEPSAVEWVGWTAGGEFRRGGRENFQLSAQGTATKDGNNVVTANTSTSELSEGSFTFNIAGAFTLADTVSDPTHGFSPPENYACGWPKSDAPAYEGDYVIEIGSPMPDAVMLDACDEPVRLYDFAGKWMLIDMSATDCPPCRNMAAGEGAFVEQMASEGFDVEVITLLAPTLGAVLDPTPGDTLRLWTETYDLHSPVLADRGFGYWVVGPAVGPDFGYPSSVLVAPDLSVVDATGGFGSFDHWIDIIRAHE